MIFVTTGTNAGAAPFDRLLREVAQISRREHVVVQHGASAIRPPGATCLDYVPFERFEQLVREARAVVTHAGVGSILVSLRNGKRPIVVPRCARFGEHVDDHQLELSRRLGALGIVTVVDDPARLEQVLFDGSVAAGAGAVGRTGRLADDLAEYLSAVCGDGRDGQETSLAPTPAATGAGAADGGAAASR